MQRLLRVLTVVALGLLVTACGSSSSRPAPSPPATGAIRGQLLTYGGLSLSPQGRPFDGHVRATDATGKTVVVAVPSDGNFALEVAPGTYSLTGSSPQFGDGRYGCFAQSKVVVKAGRSSTATVVCHEK